MAPFKDFIDVCLDPLVIVTGLVVVVARYYKETNGYFYCTIQGYKRGG